MMEFLRFTFDGFWHFVGVFALLSLAAQCAVVCCYYLGGRK